MDHSLGVSLGSVPWSVLWIQPLQRPLERSLGFVPWIDPLDWSRGYPLDWERSSERPVHGSHGATLGSDPWSFLWSLKWIRPLECPLDLSSGSVPWSVPRMGLLKSPLERPLDWSLRASLGPAPSPPAVHSSVYFSKVFFLLLHSEFRQCQRRNERSCRRAPSPN